MPLHRDPPTGLGPVGPAWTNWMGYLDIWLQKFRHYHKELAPSSVSANTTAEQTFTVAGLTTNDVVYVNKPTHQAGLGIGGCRVPAADTLAITYVNVTGGGITPSTESYDIIAIRKD